jgi:hypothetical protein
MSTAISSLPPEIMLLIGQELNQMDDLDTIHQLTLTSRAWCELTRGFLFSFMVLKLAKDEVLDEDYEFEVPEHRSESFTGRRLQFFSEHPHLAKMVIEIKIINYPLREEEVDQMKAMFIRLAIINSIRTDLPPDVLAKLLYEFPHLNRLLFNTPGTTYFDPFAYEALVGSTSAALATLMFTGPAYMCIGLLKTLANSQTRDSLAMLSLSLENFQSTDQYTELLRLCRQFANIRELIWSNYVVAEDPGLFQRMLSQKLGRSFLRDVWLAMYTDTMDVIDVTLGSIPSLRVLSMNAGTNMRVLRFLRASIRDAHLPHLSTLRINVHLHYTSSGQEFDVEESAEGGTPGRSLQDSPILSASMAAQLARLEFNILDPGTLARIRANFPIFITYFGREIRREIVKIQHCELTPDHKGLVTHEIHLTDEEWPNTKDRE